MITIQKKQKVNMQNHQLTRMVCLMITFILLLTSVMPLSVLASSNTDTIETTLISGEYVCGSRLTFDVIARNQNGEKIPSSVTMDGSPVPVNWNDDIKTSYTLSFGESGEYHIFVKAGDALREYTLNYVKSLPGEPIGEVVFAVERFTIGGGYMIEPVYVPIYEGENCAYLLDRVLTEHGYTYTHTGNLDMNFYLSVIHSNTNPPFLSEPYIPDELLDKLAENDFNIRISDDYSGGLGEFNYTSGSGWMYSVNNVFPNVGFCDYYPKDGDVIRVQFTLAYGADIGGGYTMGGSIEDSNYFPPVSRDRFTQLLATAQKHNMAGYSEYSEIPSLFGIEQSDLDDLTEDLSAIVCPMIVQNIKESIASLSDTDCRSGKEIYGIRKAFESLPYTYQAQVENLQQLIDAENTVKHVPCEGEKECVQAVYCQVCGFRLSASGKHMGGVADCTKKATCEICGKAYGETTPHIPESDDGDPTTPVRCRYCHTVLIPAEPINSKNSPEIFNIAQDIIAWKKLDNGSSPSGYLINDTYLQYAGTTAGDWYPIGLGRLNIKDNNEAYLAVIKDKVEERYQMPGRLHSAKSTEWHRIALAILAMGGDPTSCGICNGQSIDLIADGTYDRGKTDSLGRQGINGWIWGLIALDSKRYEIPNGSFYSRDDIIIEILRKQLVDGGFALSGNSSDTDITAMAIQALAPYYNSENTYTYTEKRSGQTVSRTVRDVVDEAIGRLSEMQLPTGDFESWGTKNAESTAQVIVALCSLGLDPLTDERFIKSEHTLLDGILLYRMKDGGFVHSYTYDPNNPTSLPDRSNTMASEQVLYAMASLWRQVNGMRTLYDFRAEQSTELKLRITMLEAKITAVCEATDTDELSKLLQAFYALPENERCYVSNYWRLSDLAKSRGFDITAIANTTDVIASGEEDEKDTVLLSFSGSDKAAVNALPDRLTTEYYVTVVTLLDKLEKSEDFKEKEEYRNRLADAKAIIADIQREIDSINADVKEKLYPFDKIGLSDKKTVDEIVRRYEALSEYDRQKIERIEDIVKTKTKLDNTVRAGVIGVVCVVVAGGLFVTVVIRITKRKHKKEREMEELAEMFEVEL